MSDRKIMARAIAELWPDKARMAWSAAAVVLRSILMMLPPLFTKQIIDVALTGALPSMLWRYTLGSFGVMVGAVSLILADVWASSYVQGASTRLRTRLFRGLLSRPLSFFHATSTGKLLARLLQDSQAFTDLFFNSFGSGIFGTAAWALTTGSIGVAAMIWLDPILALICGLMYGLQLLLMTIFGRHAKAAGLAVAETRAALTETVRESVTGIGFVKSSGLESHLSAQFDSRLADVEAAELKNITIRRISRMTDAAPEILSTGLIYLVGGYRVLSDDLTLGGLVAFTVYAWWVQGIITTLTELYVDVKRMLPAVDRTFTLLDEPLPPDGTLQPDSCRGAIQFDRVTFGYEPERPVLKNFSLSITPGEVVAIVGPSGAGKSTIADLVQGLQNPQKGSVLLDGQDLALLDPSWVRSRVCAVAQDVAILNDTVAANVRYGRPDADAGALELACTDATASEFIGGLPHGVETTVGERGLQLSGGQRQRLSVARALLYEPQVLVLDEATSTLDVQTEVRLLANLRSRLAGRTVIMIAHRLSTVQEADRIVVLDEGRVVEEGPHAELLTRNGVYRALYAQETAITV